MKAICLFRSEIFKQKFVYFISDLIVFDLKAGDQIEVTNVVNDEWLAGCSLYNGESVSFGIFPSSFVEYLPAHDDSTVASGSNVTATACNHVRRSFSNRNFCFVKLINLVFTKVLTKLYQKMKDSTDKN